MATPKSALPEDFELTEQRRSWAKIHAPQVNLQVEFDQFRDHAKATGWRMVDWEATWRNWLRKAQKAAAPRRSYERAAPPAPTPQPPRFRPGPGPVLSGPRRWANQRMLRAVVKAGGVDPDTLQRMIAAKNHVAEAWEPFEDELDMTEYRDMVDQALRKAYRPAAR
jgi:hypothetical protein